MGKKGGSNLGRQLVKKQIVHRKGPGTDARTDGRSSLDGEYLHTSELQDGYDWGRMNLQSVTEEASYIDFLNTAEQARHEFDAERWNVKLLDGQTRQVYIDTSDKLTPKAKLSAAERILSVPRRPAWTGLTPQQLSDKENDAFLDWRRKLAEIQETTDTVITPYEKNLEFWRQLWRVIERSDLIVQIVDARNPLMFRSQDLEAYVKEVSPLKQNLILLNKADFLSLEQRKTWVEYLTKNIGSTRFAFFSAITEDNFQDDDDGTEEHVAEALKQKLNQLNLAASKDNTIPATETTPEEVSSGSQSAPEEVSSQPAPEEASSPSQPASEEASSPSQPPQEEDTQYEDLEQNPPDNAALFPDPCEILTSDRLMQLFRTYKRYSVEHTTVGFIGYPNVGKSSTINKLLSSKKVRVSETPGKTKHFQTLVLAEDLTLCDCPGLVMPSVVSSKAEMVLNGILPCDQLRDCVPSVQLLLQHIPTHVLEYKYGMVLPGEPKILEHEQVLTAYATLRGYMAIGGRPDQSRAARIILKDYVAGKLVHCVAPPDVDQASFHIHEVGDLRVWHSEEAKQKEAQRLQQQKKLPQQVLDEKFFSRAPVAAHVRGNKNTGRLSDKSWKQKKKARILYKDYDGKSAGLHN